MSRQTIKDKPKSLNRWGFWVSGVLLIFVAVNFTFSSGYAQYRMWESNLAFVGSLLLLCAGILLVLVPALYQDGKRPKISREQVIQYLGMAVGVLIVSALLFVAAIGFLHLGVE